MTNDFRISALCLLGPLTLFGCGDPGAFEEVPKDGTSGEPPSQRTTAFDVAEDGTRFAYDDELEGLEGFPGDGSAFVTQGYLYPFGFLIGREAVDEDGRPAHPEHVIGVWTCWGHVIGDGVESESGAWAVSTHLYEFYETPGYAEDKEPSRHTIVSEGYEGADTRLTITRSITGASGVAKGATGEVLQMLYDTNASGGANLRMVIPDGFAPLITPEDLPEGPPRSTKPCNWDLFDGSGCELF